MAIGNDDYAAYISTPDGEVPLRDENIHKSLRPKLDITGITQDLDNASAGTVNYTISSDDKTVKITSKRTSDTEYVEYQFQFQSDYTEDKGKTLHLVIRNDNSFVLTGLSVYWGISGVGSLTDDIITVPDIAPGEFTIIEMYLPSYSEGTWCHVYVREGGVESNYNKELTYTLCCNWEVDAMTGSDYAEAFDYFRINQANEKISSLSEETRNIKSDLYGSDSDTPENITWENGFYTENGNFNQYDNYCVTNYIPVSYGYEINATGLFGVGKPNVAVPMVLFNESKKTVEVVTELQGDSVSYKVSNDVIKYARIGFSDINQVSKVNIYINKDTLFTPIYKRLDTLDNIFSEKVIWCLGDSITYLPGSWAHNIAKKLNAKKVIIIARGGATWGNRENYIYYSSSPLASLPIVSTISSDGKTVSFDANTDLSNGNLPSDNNNYTFMNNEIQFMMRLISEGYESPDLIIVACGINDTGVNTTKYSDESFNSIFNTDRDSMSDQIKKTIGGGLRLNIETLRYVYNKSQLIVGLPIQTAYAYFRPYLPNTIQWMEKMCEYYSVPTIDAYRQCGITKAFEKGWEDESYNGENSGRYLFDGLHPNSDGNKLMTNFYAKEVQKKFIEFN